MSLRGEGVIEGVIEVVVGATPPQEGTAQGRDVVYHIMITYSCSNSTLELSHMIFISPPPPSAASCDMHADHAITM